MDHNFLSQVTWWHVNLFFIAVPLPCLTAWKIIWEYTLRKKLLKILPEADVDITNSGPTEQPSNLELDDDRTWIRSMISKNLERSDNRYSKFGTVLFVSLLVIGILGLLLIFCVPCFQSGPEVTAEGLLMCITDEEGTNAIRSFLPFIPEFIQEFSQKFIPKFRQGFLLRYLDWNTKAVQKWWSQAIDWNSIRNWNMTIFSGKLSPNIPTWFRSLLNPEEQLEWINFMHMAYKGCGSDEDWHTERGSCIHRPNLASSYFGAKVVKAKFYPTASEDTRTSNWEPDVVLMDRVEEPRKAWSFKGQAELVVNLPYPALIIGFTIHHPPKPKLLPEFFTSAPKEMALFGLSSEEDKEQFSFGTFYYSEKGLAAQTFIHQHYSGQEFNLVKLVIRSNHGNPEVTTLYKFEVYGFIKKLKTQRLAEVPEITDVAEVSEDSNDLQS